MTRENSKTLGELYLREFQPEFYVSKYYAGPDTGNEFCLRNLHEYFSDSHSSECSDILPKRVLELGSGPVPVHLLSASRSKNEIICTDYLEQNRNKLNQWLSSDQKEEDDRWIPYAKYVAELESEGLISASNYPSKLVLERTRNAIRSVLPCDVLQSDPLLGSPHAQQLFDVVISAFCLECAVGSPSEYPNAVANAVNLLRPSGHLITIGGLEGEYYYVYDKKVPRIKLTKDMMSAALESAGCHIVEWKELPRSLRPPELPIDYTAMYYCVAEKK